MDSRCAPAFCTLRAGRRLAHMDTTCSHIAVFMSHSYSG